MVKAPLICLYLSSLKLNDLGYSKPGKKIKIKKASFKNMRTTPKCCKASTSQSVRWG